MDGTALRRAIYFACDDNPRVLSQLTTSVHSIRASGCHLPIHVVLVGEAPQETIDVLSRHSARVVGRRWHEYPRLVRWQPTFLKWVALQEAFDYQELLYLDTDTFAFRNPTQLFEALGPEDLHARCSLQALETQDLETQGLLLVRPPGCMPSYQRRYRALQTHLGIQPVFGLNSGIMLFKNGSHKRIREHLALFRTIQLMLCSGWLPYPMPLRAHLMEEVVARLVIGFLDGFRCKEIPDTLCPYYIHSYHSLGAPPAILTHTFRGHYAHFLFTQFGKAACQRYLAISQASKRDSLKSLLQWAWIFLIHGSGIASIGKSWKCALAGALVRSATRRAAA